MNSGKKLLINITDISCCRLVIKLFNFRFSLLVNKKFNNLLNYSSSYQVPVIIIHLLFVRVMCFYILCNMNVFRNNEINKRTCV